MRLHKNDILLFNNTLVVETGMFTSLTCGQNPFMDVCFYAFTILKRTRVDTTVLRFHLPISISQTRYRLVEFLGLWRVYFASLSR